MAQQQFQVDRTTALYERPPMDIVDAAAFAEVKKAIESSFVAGNVETFLKSVDRSSLRIRSFEAVLSGGKLGAGTAAQYAKLSNGDQGQIRELYLASLEQVDLALRDKFFKLYAYY
jgi:superfamily II DNA helicase RecQ